VAENAMTDVVGISETVVADTKKVTDAFVIVGRGGAIPARPRVFCNDERAGAGRHAYSALSGDLRCTRVQDEPPDAQALGYSASVQLLSGLEVGAPFSQAWSA
jgi:hypothetical protein